MLDHAVIFTRGGIVIWSHEFAKVKGTPVDDLVRIVMLGERGGDDVFTTDTAACRWKVDNALGLVYVIVHQSLLKLSYVPELLDKLQERVGPWYAKFRARDDLPSVDDAMTHIESFFLNAAEECERRAKDKKAVRGGGDASPAPTSTPAVSSTPVDVNPANSMDNLERSASPTSGGEASGRQKYVPKPKRGTASADKLAASKSQPKRSQRVWDDKVSTGDAKSLNFAGSDGATPAPNNDDGDDDDGQADVDVKQKFGEFNFDFEATPDGGDDNVEQPVSSNNEPAKKSSFFSMFSSLTGMQIIPDRI